MEPGNLADSYRRSIRIVPIACQSKRRDVCTAAQRGRGDTVVVVKIFHWEGEPQRELDTATTTSLRTLQLIIRITASTYSGATPFFLCGITVYIPYGTYTQLNRTSQAEDLPLESTTLYPFTP